MTKRAITALCLIVALIEIGLDFVPAFPLRLGLRVGLEVILFAISIAVLYEHVRQQSAHQERQRTLAAIIDLIAPQAHQDSPRSAPATQDHQTAPLSGEGVPRALGPYQQSPKSNPARPE